MRIGSVLPAVAAVLSVLLIGTQNLKGETALDNVGDLAAAPPLPGCHPADNAESPYWSIFRGPDQRVQQLYDCGGVTVQIDVARFLVQHTGKEAISDTNRVIDTVHVSAALPSYSEFSDGFRAEEYRIDSRMVPGVAWTWYAIGDRAIAGKLHAKLVEARDRLVGWPNDTSIIVLIAWEANVNSAREQLRSIAPTVWDWYLARNRIES